MTGFSRFLWNASTDFECCFIQKNFDTIESHGERFGTFGNMTSSHQQKTIFFSTQFLYQAICTQRTLKGLKYDVKQIAPVGAEIIFRKSQEISSIYLNPLYKVTRKLTVWGHKNTPYLLNSIMSPSSKNTVSRCMLTQTIYIYTITYIQHLHLHWLHVFPTSLMQ